MLRLDAEFESFLRAECLWIILSRLTIEFLSTFSENKEGNDDDPNGYMVRLFGMKKGLSLNKMNRCLRVPVEYIATEEYENAHKTKIVDFNND